MRPTPHHRRSCGCAAANGRPLLTDAPNSDITAANTPTSGNVLDNASLPAGTTATITGFTVSGSSTVHAPGAPVALTDPTKGTPVGTLVVNPDGSYTFTPAPDYVGAVPAIQTNVRSSDGQTVTSALTITVLPSELCAGHGARALVLAKQVEGVDTARICTPCLFLCADCLTVLVRLPLCVQSSPWILRPPATSPRPASPPRAACWTT